MERKKHVEAISLRNISVVAEKKGTFTPYKGRERRRSSSLAPIAYEINQAQVVDSFFVTETESGDVTYISEVITSDVNPDFQRISWPLGLSDGFHLKVWTKLESNGAKWSLLIHIIVDITQLIRINTSDESSYASNSVLFYMSGNIYTYTPFIINKSCIYQSKPSLDPINKHPIKLYTFDSIRTMNGVHRYLVESERSKRKILLQIEEISNKSTKYTPPSSIKFNTPKSIEETKSSIIALTKYLRKQRISNDSVALEISRYRVAKNNLELSLHSFQEINHYQEEIIDYESQIMPNLEYRSPAPIEISNLLKNHISILSEAFSIENIANTNFKIMGVFFPTSIKEIQNICYYNDQFRGIESHETKISFLNAGLQYISQMIFNIANIIGVDLRYPILRGDVILNPLTSTQYLLQYDNNNTKKDPTGIQDGIIIRPHILNNQDFEIALSLLHKDLNMLVSLAIDLHYNYSDPKVKRSAQQNVPLDHKDNFLWNLEYLVLLLTAT